MVTKINGQTIGKFNVKERMLLTKRVSKKGLVDIGRMIENDWKVEVTFFHQMTGIDAGFFNKYITRTSKQQHKVIQFNKK
ncbi:hypothetical protein M5X00_13135 [Paenibacillus alvei]|uniref:hypothetical protein n=1 Tax=Paenibacillus alvei TaxID=44250 RepID=UPI000313D8D8|nr:hypothetical protein [Paenibacillus alvei]MCY9540531.1 hypothetical protein [Paenibacillus alvei]MCY9732940.1 hypothetical protein [Paenibacillus alvei]MCY9755184.1 hypothetical protein [Paenibacillus alvei]MEC0080336.1 hypothetical protein [Paenibacillus alvei]